MTVDGNRTMMKVITTWVMRMNEEVNANSREERETVTGRGVFLPHRDDGYPRKALASQDNPVTVQQQRNCQTSLRF